MLDQVQLRSFVAVAEALSFTAAAAQLRMTQSAVSKHVRALEASVGRVLLERDTRSMSLTAAGDAMLTYARRILSTFDDAEAYFAGTTGVGRRFSIGAHPWTMAVLFPEVLSRFRQRHPEVVLDVRSGDGPDLVNSVRSGDLDIAVVWRTEYPGSQIIFPRRYVWIGRPEVTVRRGAPLPIVLLQGLYPSSMSLFRLLEDAGWAWDITVTARDWHAVWSALYAGLGIIAVPEDAIPHGLVRLSGEGLPPPLTVEFAIAESSRAPRELVAGFHEILQGVLPSA
jgi:DNA-binding transcriptional LysR family regulator